MRATLVLLTACSFHANSGQPALADGAPPPPTDTRVIDAPVDATPDAAAILHACAFELTDSGLDNSGRAGGTGGSPTASIECDAPTDLIVGIALRMSNQNTVFGERSAAAIDIACAPVTINPDLSAEVGTIYTREAAGGGADGWTPATLTSTAQCPADSVVTGIDVHTTSAGDMFQNVTLTCSQLGLAGTLTGATSSVYVAGSLTDTNGDSAVPCNAGHVLRRIDPATGAGLDSVTLRCTPAQCQP